MSFGGWSASSPKESFSEASASKLSMEGDDVDADDDGETRAVAGRTVSRRCAGVPPRPHSVGTSEKSTERMMAFGTSTMNVPPPAHRTDRTGFRPAHRSATLASTWPTGRQTATSCGSVFATHTSTRTSPTGVRTRPLRDATSHVMRSLMVVALSWPSRANKDFDSSAGAVQSVMISCASERRGTARPMSMRAHRARAPALTRPHARTEHAHTCTHSVISYREFTSP